MSGKQNGLRRNMGVKQTKVPEPKRFTRPEGTHKPIEATAASSAGETQHTMAPKRWAERQQEKGIGL